MKCHYCGEEIAEGQSYCLWCGTRQEPEGVPKPEQLPAVANQPEPEKRRDPLISEVPEASAATLPEVPVAPPQPVPESRPVARIVRPEPPRLQLPVKRGMWKMLFLGLLTLGIYPTVIWSRIVTELNLAASRYDGKRTMPYFAMVLLAPVTLGIYAFVWMHKFCRRIGDELQRRNIDYKFGPAAFWLWNMLGSLILVGPFVFLYKLMKSMNKINADYNVNG